MQGHDRVLSVEKTTENKFLNMYDLQYENKVGDRKSTRLNSSHANESRMPSSA